MRELQTAELPFKEYLKPAADMGAWYIDLLKIQCAKLEGVILLAEDKNACLGMAVLFTRAEEKGEEEEMPHTFAHISELVVTHTARGRGVGKALLDECERRSRLAGRDELTLAVLSQNEPAKRLYQKSNFEDVKIRMRKKLA